MKNQKGFAPIFILVGVLVIASLVAGGIYLNTKKPASPNQELVAPNSSAQPSSVNLISQEQAIENVKNLPEVQNFLKKTPKGKVVFDHEDKEKNAYVIHVYEDFTGHQATFDWYYINKGTGKITSELDSNQEVLNPVTKEEKYKFILQDDSANNLKVYTDSSFDFTFKFPMNLIHIESFKNDDFPQYLVERYFRPNERNEWGCYPGFGVSVLENSQKLTPSNFANHYKGKLFYVGSQINLKITPLDNTSLSAIRISGLVTGNCGSSIGPALMISHNDKIILFTTDLDTAKEKNEARKETEKLFNLILSTFKFISAGPFIEVSNKLKLYLPQKNQAFQGESTIFQGEMKGFFEGTLNVRLRDSQGRELFKDFLTANDDNYEKFASFSKEVKHGKIPASAGPSGTWEFYEVSPKDGTEDVILTVPVKFTQ